MSHITLEGARVHNLRGITLQIPHNAVTVVCGVSGSGKSSLAFDTLFAEGQRRYVETFSPQARQFLDQLERPAVDRIEGIPPAIAVRQATRLTNRLSTVGSRTELLRYLQLLFAQRGQPHCPRCGNLVQAWTPDRVAEQVIESVIDGRFIIAFVPSSDGEPDESVNPEDFLTMGFTRCFHDQQLCRLEEIPNRVAAADLLIVVDRVSVRSDTYERIAEAVQQAFDQATTCAVLAESPDGTNVSDDHHWNRSNYSSSCACSRCEITCVAVSQELLSFHSVVGACAECQGTGIVKGEDTSHCSACDGTRLNPFGRSVKVNGTTLPELLSLECTDLQVWLSEEASQLTQAETQALATLLQQLRRRLAFLNDTGLGYLSLDRSLTTLSGGEARRVMLTSVLGSGLVNTLYVLDEPTSGMHETDVDRIMRAIHELKDSGNTVVVVEHDLDVIRSADHVIELGPQAGQDGGELVFEGTPRDLLQADTHTGQALTQDTSNSEQVQSPHQVDITESTPWLKASGIHCHNVSRVSIAIPLQTLCVVTGVSGSGKSSLVVDALYPALRNSLHDEPVSGDGQCEITDGVEYLSNVQLLEQNPLQRSSRSIPATYLGVFDDIRKLLAETHEARKRNFTPGTFSFNSATGGRCKRCRGHGWITIDMQFLADVETTCDNCQGKRFRGDVLDIRYRDRSVNEILNMTAAQAFVFFNGHHRIQRSLNGLRQAGLGYLSLGQSLSTLSGGEAQRLRIAALLSGVPNSEAPANRETIPGQRRETGTLFILDEPSNGLHAHDSDRLMNCLRQLVQVGHSILLIEHDGRLIQQCDYQIEMGPGPGRHGGQIINTSRSAGSN
jgi:excinuclease ABC subunit A